jgi:hypothetical protein
VKKPETGQRNSWKNKWRETTSLKAMLQKMQWPAYPRKEGFDDIELLMKRTPGSAWRAVLHHLLAIASAIIIVALNAAGLWVGKELTGTSGQDTEKLLALQFAAKLHELLMLSSLGKYYSRRPSSNWFSATDYLLVRSPSDFNLTKSPISGRENSGLRLVLRLSGKISFFRQLSYVLFSE